MVEKQEINIALDTYNDLFSDFDISPFQRRSISLDLKEELESHSSEDVSSGVNIIFSIPNKQRNLSNEKIIIKRLQLYFNSKCKNYSKRIKMRKLKGFKFVLMGFFFVTLSFIFETYLTGLIPLYLANIIMILGWFGVWTGIEKVLDIPQDLFSKSQMYNSFSKANIKFIDEEELIKN